jgi:hypothetical protein
MKKSGWISFCGWAGIASVLVSIGASQVYHRGAGLGAFAVITFLAMVFALPCFGLWVLGSLVHKFRVSGARIQAQAFVEAKQLRQDAAELRKVQLDGLSDAELAKLNIRRVQARQDATVAPAPSPRSSTAGR